MENDPSGAGTRSQTPPNATPRYSPQWFATFLETISPAQTAAEVAFVRRQFPQPQYAQLLDIACGPGRHANPLASEGYHVLGVDTDDAVLERARSQAPPGAEYRTLDIRELHQLKRTFDGVLSMWASFGYFDDSTNAAVLERIAGVLRAGGRLLLDVYNREHMQQLPASDLTVRGGVQVRTHRDWNGNRVRVRLLYATGGMDSFSWQVYTPDELVRLAEPYGFRPVTVCTWFNEAVAPSAEHARMQIVLERA